MSVKNIVSLVGARDLPSSEAISSLVWINPDHQRLLPSAASIFGQTDQNTRDVTYMFGSKRLLRPTGSYIATIRKALVSPSGLIFVDGNILYESAYPWQLENMSSQFSKDFNIDNGVWTPKIGAETEKVPSLFFAREGGEVGYFHFINSIVPKIGLYNRLATPRLPLLINSRQAFSSEFLSAYGIGDTVEPKGWMLVDELFFPSPFTVEGDHFTRPAFAYDLIREVVGKQSDSSLPDGKRIYLSRSDAAIRRLTNEKELVAFLTTKDFETVTIGDMSLKEQISLFEKTAWLVSPHGAGLSNMVWMSPGSCITEIVSPTRLWPTFRTLAARVGLNYHAVIGSRIDPSVPPLPEGNEHFSCDMWDVRMSINQTLMMA